MIDWLVKKTKTYKRLKLKFDMDEAHILRLESRLKEALRNDNRDEHGLFIEAE